jgi:hypothetical protein
MYVAFFVIALSRSLILSLLRADREHNRVCISTEKGYFALLLFKCSRPGATGLSSISNRREIITALMM